MTAHEYLKEMRDTQYFIPLDYSKGKAQKVSNSQLYRWLRDGAVVINGKRPQPEQEINYPIEQLIFFPKGNRITIK